MNKILDILKSIFSDKKKRTIFIAVAAVIVVAIIIGIILANAQRKDIGSDSSSSIIPVEDKGMSVTPEPSIAPTSTPTPTATPTPEPSPTPTPDLHPGETMSALDGSWIPNEEALKRPYCIMFNNIEFANPQSGIGEAKILYEALVEGSITRLMGVFEGLDENSSCKDRIGSVRSARHYYASVADEYDAIFIHYGETVYATRKIAELNLDHLEGTYAIGSTVYYRDKNIKAPHNAFASLEGIWKGIEKLGISVEHEEGFEPRHFTFGDVDMPEDALVANYIKLDYSSYMKPYLIYDSETGLYTRYQFGGEHIDYNTNEKLTFKNVIIQVVKEWDKDKNGYQDMDLADASGHGYYITDGKCVEITWKKNEKERTCFYYDKDGNILQINPGKTFISLFPNFREDKLIISETVEQSKK